MTPKLDQGQVCSNPSANFFDKRALQGRAKLNQQQVYSNVSAHFLDKQALQVSFFASLTQLLNTGGLPFFCKLKIGLQFSGMTSPSIHVNVRITLSEK